MKIYSVKTESKIKIPELLWRVQAGFPSPADDYIERHIDLNEQLIQNPSSTFLVRVEGESMTGAGIYPGDVLVVDKSKTPNNNDVIIAVLEGEFTVKRFSKSSTGTYLIPANPSFKPVKLDENSDFTIWGVVTTVLHNPNPTSQNW